MNRVSIALMTALALAGCSGSGGGSGPTTPTVNAAANTVASMSLTLGSATLVSGYVVYPLSISAVNSSGAAISGTYTNPISIATSDTTDTGFSTSANSTKATSSVAVTSSTQAVYFVYDGAALSSPVTLTESSPTASTKTFSFQQSSSTTTSSAIATLSLAENGAIPALGSSGSFTLTVAGYSASGALVTGTYASPIVVTTNDSAALQLSVAGGTPSNSVSVTSPSQIIIVSYNGAAVPNGTVITASTAGASTVSTAFTPGQANSTGSAGTVSSIALAQIGAPPNQGTAGQFALVVTASSSSGGVISGTYPQPIVVSSNDSTDLTFSTSPGGPFTATVTVPSSSTVVYVAYSGGDVPQTTAFSASEDTTVGTLGFNPSAVTAFTPYIKTLYVTTTGAAPVAGTTGNGLVYAAQPVYIQATDQNGNVLSGTYPTPVRMTLNNATDINLSTGGYDPATFCQDLTPPGTICPNVGALAITGSSELIFANYVDGGTGGGALQAPHPDLSITTDGIQCAVIQFPIAASGSTPYACQAVNPGAKARGSSAKTWQLVPIASKHT